MSAPPTLRASPGDWALLGLLGLIWGGSFLGVSVALGGIGPIWIAAGRIGLAAIALVAAMLAMGHRLPGFSAPVERRIWLHCVGMGLLSNAVPFTLLAWAQQKVTTGFAGITMAAVPLLVLPLAHFVVPGERLTARRLVGFATGFAGVLALIGPAALWTAPGGEGDGLARLACIAAAGCYACGAVVTRLSPPVDQVRFATAAMLVAAAAILPVALLAEALPAAPGGPALLALAYLGLMPTALATLILVRIVQRAGPSFLTLVNYQVPVWSVILGVVFLSERLPPQFVLALGLILAGLAISRAPAWRRRP
ncbi:MAG: DMT family transporter [Gemmobacter sp.]